MMMAANQRQQQANLLNSLDSTNHNLSTSFPTLVNPATLSTPTKKSKTAPSTPLVVDAEEEKEQQSKTVSIFEKKFTTNRQQRSNDDDNDEDDSLLNSDSGFLVEDKLCDCYAGSRSIFMSYIRGTHTTLIVDDFFIDKANPPLVVCVKALVATLNECAEKHATMEALVVSPAVQDHTPTFDSILKSVVAKNQNNNSNNNNLNHQQQMIFSPETIPKTKIAECACCRANNARTNNFNNYINNNHNNNNNQNQKTFDEETSSIRSINKNVTSPTTTAAARQKQRHHHHHHQREVSGSFVPDFEDQEKHPYDYLCAPQSIAIPTDLFVKLFEKNYSAIDKMDVRNPERPVIPAHKRWFAQYISAF